MKKPAQKLLTFLKTKCSRALSVVIAFLLVLNIVLQIYSIRRISYLMESSGQKLFEIERSIDGLESRTNYIEQDISSLHIALSAMENLETEERTIDDQPLQPPSLGDADKDKIVAMMFEIAPQYDLSPYMIMAMVERESNYKSNAVNGEHKGLLQISERWHKTRMDKLGVTDLFDPAGNITVACDYLKTLYDLHQDQELVLMCYSMNNDKAMELHRKGQVSVYATAVIDRMRELEEGYGD